MLFDPVQMTDAEGQTLPAGYATCVVYLQGYKAFQEVWPYQQLSIWRWNAMEDQAYNIVRQFNIDHVPDPCAGELEVTPVLSIEFIQPGDETTDVGVEILDRDPDSDSAWPQHFEVIDSAGNIVWDDCYFTGAGYAPVASADSGLIAGTLTCNGGDYTVDCLRPFDNLATTCGNQPLSDCGKLGDGCTPYWQLLATCRV